MDYNREGPLSTWILDFNFRFATGLALDSQNLIFEQNGRFEEIYLIKCIVRIGHKQRMQ